MSTVTLTIGIPASGKTTWARKEAARHGNTVIVSRDDIRHAHGWRSGRCEDLVTRIHRAQIEAALAEGLDVIVADTNINPTFRRRLIKFCHEHGADVVLMPFPISLDEAIMRDAARTEHMVGADVVKKFYSDLEKQNISEDIEIIEAPKFNPVHRYNHDSITDVVVVDIDGTVADHEGVRNPYDQSRVLHDNPKMDVINIVRVISNHYPIVFVSGRDDSCYDDTVEWICQHFEWVKGDVNLIMRKKGDNRPDYIVKNEIYDEVILPECNVIMVFDDRDQVVRHLRARGITVAQVAAGRF